MEHELKKRNENRGEKERIKNFVGKHAPSLVLIIPLLITSSSRLYKTSKIH